MDKKNLWQMLKYAIFSASAGLIQEGSFLLLFNLILGGAEKWGSLCHIISTVLSVLWNFTLNRKYTFKEVVNVPIAMLKVAAFYAVFLPVSGWLVDLAPGVGLSMNVAQILAMLANFVLEFAYFKFVVFKGKDEQK